MELYFGYMGRNKNKIENDWLKKVKAWLNFSVEDMSELNRCESSFFLMNINIKKSTASICTVQMCVDGCVFYNEQFYNNDSIDHIENIEHILETGGCSGRYTVLMASKDNSITIFNDYYGFNAFFYYTNGDGIFFSNDIRLLLLCDEVAIKVNVDKCKLTNTELFVNNENFDTQTYFSGIKKIPNGVKCKIKEGNIQYKSIYDNAIFYNGEFLNFSDKEQYYKKFRDTLNRVVNQFVLSYGDGSIGVSLSGGIDSAVILASLIDLGYKDRVICYHATSNNPLYFSCNDSEIVRKLVKKLGVKCKILYQNSGNSICNAVMGRDYIKNINGPCCIGNDSFSYHLSAELEKDNVSLLFGGDGGDYLFMGTRYCQDVFKYCGNRSEAMAHKTIMKQQKKDNYLYKYAQFIPFLNNYYYRKNYWKEDDKVGYPSFFTKEMQKTNKSQKGNNYRDSKVLKFWARRFAYDFMFPKGIVDDERNDGYEFVHPLLDISIYTLAQQIPPYIHYDISKGDVGSYYVQKRVLREAYKDILPDIITEQKFKTNYAPSIVLKFKKESKNLAELMGDDKELFLAKYGIVKRDEFLRELEVFLLNIFDPHFVPNLAMKYMYNLIYLEIWLKEIHLGREWMLEQCKIHSKVQDRSEVEVINV